MKALIIGAAGFVGGHLINHLAADCGYEVYATKLAHEKLETENASVHNLDILDKNAVSELLNEIKPDQIYHLAAQSSVKLSWDKPQLTADINIKGTINVLEAVRDVNSFGQIVEINRRVGVSSDAEVLVCRTYTSDGNYRIGLYNFDGEPVFNGKKLDAPCLYFKPIEKVGYVNVYCYKTEEGSERVFTGGTVYDTEEEALKNALEGTVQSYLKTISFPYTI